MTSRTCIFEVSSKVKTKTLLESGIDLKHRAWTVLNIETSHGDHDLPDVGYRISEYNEDKASRPGPWVVISPPQSFFARNSEQRMQEVYLYECDYQPLENPGEWVEPKRLSVPTHIAKEIGMELPAETAV